MALTLHTARKGFTLVEMLAVLAIIGLLIGISVPVFNIVGASRGVRADVMRLNGVLRLARQHAIMNRTYTYVVFVGNFPGVLEEHRHRAFAVMEGTAAQPLTYVTPWHTLSQGSFFVPVEQTGMPTKEVAFFDVIGPADSRSVTVPYPETVGGSPRDLFAMQFRPDGRVRYLNRDRNEWRTPGGLYISVAPGFINEVTGDVIIPDANRNRTGRVEIHGRTGTSKVRYDPRT